MRQLVAARRSLDSAARKLKISPLSLSKVMGGQSVSRGMRALIAAECTLHCG
jgi:hypothetical protein